MTFPTNSAPEANVRILPIMTLREVAIFPHTIMPLFVGRETSVKAIEQAISSYGKYIFLVTQKEADVEKPNPNDLHTIGVVSRILQLMRLPDGSIKVLFEGLYRATWQAFKELTEETNTVNPFGTKPYPCLITTQVNEIDETPEHAEALYRAVYEAMEEFAKINRKLTPEHVAAISGLHLPGRLADAIMPHLRIDFTKKQETLEILNTAERLEKTYEYLNGELAVASIEKSIKGRVKDQIERNQREYYLTEQIKAIHKEMGSEDPYADADELEQLISAKDLPDEAKEKAQRELRKLRPMSPASAEYTVARNYIEWILDLPWNTNKEISIDIRRARKVLNDAHFGLKKPKKRILEYLAVQKLTDSLRGPILCFVGPPGVGKTSLAKSVAKATGREFVRISLGGVRDEAEIRGHRRTYVGAMPGKIIMAIKKAKFGNPLICLDEIDKMTSDFRGDPSSALLEVLDPEQNSSFSDHYLDLDYDLSKVFFVTTANSLSQIPGPLRDRMEIIELSSYLETEKMKIAKDFLLPKQWKEHGISADNLTITDDAMLEIIRSYTREAGVRNLEREIAALCRKTAIVLVDPTIDPNSDPNVQTEFDLEADFDIITKSNENTNTKGASNTQTHTSEIIKVTKKHNKTCYNTDDADSIDENSIEISHITVDTDNLNTYLGVQKYRFGERDTEAQIGVVAGLAYNSVGGDILYIETAIMPGSGKISTTGQLGDVMKESAEAAFSYVRSRAPQFGLKSDFYKELDIHVHVPEGATPKDGPSAGITMATSISSALLGIPVLDTVAMTGEITLRGRVLPIGGLREKLLAARRTNIKTVLLPIDNKKDLEDVPKEILDDLEIHFVKDVDEVLPIAFDKKAEQVFNDKDKSNFIDNLRKISDTHSVLKKEKQTAPKRTKESTKLVTRKTNKQVESENPV